MKRQQVFKQDNSNNPFSGAIYTLTLIVCFYLSFLLGTEYVAFKFGLNGFYQPYMGIVWTVLAVIHGTKDDVFVRGLWVTGISIIVSFLTVHLIFYIQRRRVKETEVFGSAKWAIFEDLIGKFINQPKGNYIGAFYNEKDKKTYYLQDDGKSHILAVGPTGAGKGTGLVVPNLLSDPSSVVVTDIKGENYLITSGYRKHVLKQNIFVFNPTSIDKVICKKELDVIGMDWLTFVEKLKQAGFAEQVDDERIVLKEDFTMMKDTLKELFPGDIENNDFLSVLKRPQIGPGSRWNPLKEIRKGAHEVKDTQNIVETICDPDGTGRNNHWVLASKPLLTLFILHTLYARRNKNLAGVLVHLSDPKLSIYPILDAMMQTEHDPTGQYGWKDSSGMPTKVNPTIASLAREMKNKGFEELQGIISTTTSFLSVFRDPIVAENTSDSDFTISDIILTPSTVYAIFPPSDIQRIVPIMRIFINLLCSRLMENSNLNMVYEAAEQLTSFWGGFTKVISNWFDMKKTIESKPVEQAPLFHVKKKQKVLLMLDEFPALGRMENLKTAIAYMRGYNLRCFLICQDLEQLSEIYGKNSIIGHCGIKISYAANSEQTAKMVSGWAGETTIVKYSKSYSETQADHVSAGASEIKRALILPDEVHHLDPTVSLIFANGINIYGKKIVYFTDAWFLKMSQIAPALIGDKVETKNEFWLVNNVVEYEVPKLTIQNGKVVQTIKKEPIAPRELQEGIDKNKKDTLGAELPDDIVENKLI
jgi:type IV secretory pathway TraG/TraD family ATPase VirD4